MVPLPNHGPPAYAGPSRTGILRHKEAISRIPYETVWYLCSGLSKPFFAELLAAFARQTGAGRKRHVILVLDNAGWHGPEGLPVPDGISLVFLPPYSPELQPAEHLWPLVDEPIANRHFATLADLEAVVAERCRRLGAETVRPHTDFHWWPKPISPN
jgi:transposase